MFSSISKSLRKSSALLKITKKNYHPVRELMQKKVPKFYSDPDEIGQQIVRIVSLHDNCKDPSSVTLGSTFEECGLDSLDFVDVISQVEYDYLYDFGSADWEQFITINDVAQFMAKDFFAVKH